MNVMVRAKYIALTLLAVWVFSMMYVMFTMNGTAREDAALQNEIVEKALKEMEKLREENSRLLEIFQKKRRDDFSDNQERQSVKTSGDLIIMTGVEPSKVHEVLRRRVEMDVAETWLYVRSQLDLLKRDLHNPSAAADRINHMLADVMEYYGVTSNDLASLASVDGTDKWRVREARDLSDLVSGVLEKLQNPKNCSTSRLLLCNLSKGCGFGCQVHHTVYCLITAIGTNRTFVLSSKHWRYLDDGWSKFFLPVSSTCNESHANNAMPWTENHSARVIQLPIIDTISPRPDFLPLAIPKQIADRLVRLHGDPFVWWVGQLLGYLLRPQPLLVNTIKENMASLGLKSGRGVVGVHIRRTDKVAAEAAFHDLDEYMVRVEKYFDKVDLGRSFPVKRSIYLASDDPNVFGEVAAKYPHYLVYGNRGFSETASLNSRYSEASLKAVILDVHFLSMCDHLICTFSSQVCRLAYELMQTMHGDASQSFTSLDDIYYFGGQLGHNRVMRLNHKPRDSTHLSLKKGDLVKIAGNHWNGYSMGEASNTRGLYPSFKALEKVHMADFPIFNEFISKKSPSPPPSPASTSVSVQNKTPAGGLGEAVDDRGAERVVPVGMEIPQPGLDADDERRRKRT